jgi:hypothetical protein
MTDSAEPSLWGDLHPIVGNFDGADIGEDVGGDVGVDAGPGALPILWRRRQRAHGNDRAIHRHLVAARRGSLGWDDREVSFGAAIGGQKHLVLIASHAAGRLIAV